MKVVKAPKPAMPKTKKRYIVGLSVLVSSAIASGILLGVLYLSFFYQPPVNYGNETDLRADEAAIYAKYKDHEITTLDGTTAFIIAEYKTKQQQKLTLRAEGKVDPSMSSAQTIYTTRYLDQTRDLYYVENISKGKVIFGIDTNIAERNYYDATTDTLTVYRGWDTRETSATFDMDHPDKTMTLAEWKAINGTTPLSFHPYIVSARTVINATKPTACTLDDGNAGYTFTLSLNKNAASIYVRQIKNLSKLPENPNFDYINITVFLNQDGTFHTLDCDERYYVHQMGMNVSTKSNLLYQFTYNGDIIIPNIDDKGANA